MKYHVIILIILIIILIIYLIYNNIQDYNDIEKFSTQGSLSINNPTQTILNNYPHNWNGIWENIDIPINTQFLQINDKLIIAMSNSNFTDIYNSNNENIINSCNNMFIGIGQLNLDKNSFYIMNVYCNMYKNDILNIGKNTEPNNGTDTFKYFSGKIQDNHIILTPNNPDSTNSIILTLKNSFNNNVNINDYPYLSRYAQEIAPFVSAYPLSEESSYEYNICPPSTELCINTNQGLNADSYNACGKIDNGTTNNCNNNVTCYLNVPSGSSLPVCSPYVNQYLNFNVVASSQNSNNQTNLDVCNYLSNFSSSYCNAVILCYISNIGNVQTLNYQFFGSKHNESSLITQYDIMNSILNSNSGSNLQKYRNIISSVNTNSIPTVSSQLLPIIKSLSFTNCLTNNNIGMTNQLISNCSTTSQGYINNYTPTNSNNNLMPAVWQINVNNKFNLTNSCGFTLSTFNGYNTFVKYVQCNDDNTVNLNIYGGGLGQSLYFDSLNILTELNPKPNPPFIAMTANIRSNNGSYLIPDTAFGGFMNNSNIITLKNSPETNGKWLILGFSLNSLNNLTSIINSFNF